MTDLDLTPFLARGFGEKSDRLIANIKVEGIDKYHTLSQIRLAPETAGFLYGAFTPLTVTYHRGSRPRLEKIVAEVLSGVESSPRAQVLALLEWTAQVIRHAMHVKGETPVDRALSEEALLDSGWGYCNEKARILVSLAQIAGYPGRMVSIYHSTGIHGHMVSEIHVEGEWAMADPTFAVVVPKNKGRWASAKDLSWEASLNSTTDEVYRAGILKMDRLHGPGMNVPDSILVRDRPCRMFAQIGISNYPIFSFPKG